jgi:hypothetical protein
MSATTDSVSLEVPPAETRRRTADVIFRGALAFNSVLTLFWIATYVTGSRYFFRDYSLNLQTATRIFWGIAFFHVIWGVIWWAIKTGLLRWLVGFTKDERRAAFSSRMDRPYDVADLVSRYSERRIRIADMLGRRGRFITLGAAGLFYLYLQISQRQNDNFATAFLTDNLLDSIVGTWILLALYRSNNLIAAFFYGAQSRVMDGSLARANYLLIATLWTAFKFVMVPIGARLAAIFPKPQFAALFGLIWGTYLVTDACAEIFGSLFGRQTIQVWGIGDINRKSVAGIVGGFCAALILGLWIVTANGLGTPWIVLAIVLAISNTALELYSPRGTDDFTMATANALICLAFGTLIR